MANEQYKIVTVKTASWVTINLASVWRVVQSSKLAHDAGKLLAVQFVGRVVTFFASAYAMRSLGPEQLGIGAFVLSIVAQGAVLGDLGLNIAGVRALGNHPDRRDEIVSIVWGIRLRAAVVLSILMLVGVWVLYPLRSMTLWLLAAPLLILSVLSPQWIFQGMKRVPVFNMIQLVQTMVTALLYFGLFRPGARAELYVTVSLLVQALGWGLSYFVLHRQVNIRWLNFDWREAWEMVRDSGYAFAIVLTIFVYTSLDIPLVTLLRSTEEAGIYRSAQSIMSVIMPFLAILPLLVYPRLVSWKNQSLELFFRNSLILVAGLSVVAVLMVVSSIIWVPVAFEMLLGSPFIGGIWPCVMLVLAKGLVLVGAVPAWGLHSLNLDRRYLIVTLCAAASSITFNLLFVPRLGIIAAGAANILSEMIIVLGASFAVYSFLRSHRTERLTRKIAYEQR